MGTSAVADLVHDFLDWLSAKMNEKPPPLHKGLAALVLEDEVHRLQDENSLLRALLAWGSDPCIHCSLQSCDMSRCAKGFPGCWRSEDMDLRYDQRGWARWKGVDRRAKR